MEEGRQGEREMGRKVRKRDNEGTEEERKGGRGGDGMAGDGRGRQG